MVCCVSLTKSVRLRHSVTFCAYAFYRIYELGKIFAGRLLPIGSSSEPHVFPPCIPWHVSLYSVALFGHPGCASSFLAIFTPTQRHSTLLWKQRKIVGILSLVLAMSSVTAPTRTKSQRSFASLARAPFAEITTKPQPI